jgi:hypothetical protein
MDDERGVLAAFVYTRNTKDEFRAQYLCTRKDRTVADCNNAIHYDLEITRYLVQLSDKMATRTLHTAVSSDLAILEADFASTRLPFWLQSRN